MGTQKYLLSKIGQLVLTLLFVLTIAFFMFRVWMPGDPVKTFVRSTGSHFSQEQQDQIRHDWGLDRPLFPDQYLDFMTQSLTFNFGFSTVLQPGVPVGSLFWEKMGKSAILITTSTIASIIVGVYLGVKGGWKRRGALDNTSMAASMVLYAMPEFVLGMILLLLFSNLVHWFPSGGYESYAVHYTGIDRLIDIVKHMALPWLTLTLAYLGEFYLVMRSSLLDVLGEEYIALARAKGVRERFVLRRHAVPNALLPTITLVALSFGFILGGVITVELVFSYPGVGKLSVDALTARDMPMLQATFIISVIAVLVANLIADLLYAYLDPRVRRA